MAAQNGYAEADTGTDKQAPESLTGKVRLDVWLRENAGIPRKQAKQLIGEQRITVDAEPAPAAGNYVDPHSDIRLDGQRLQGEKQETWLLNKPCGYICAASDSRYPSVLSLLPEEAGKGLFTVGRLDVDTEGLLLITADGLLCSRILRPEHAIEKAYLVTADRPLDGDAEERLAEGLTVPNGTRFRPAGLTRISELVSEIRVTEGRYHEVRRMIRECGARVKALKRIRIGGLSLPDDLPEGKCIPLPEEEIRKIFCENPEL